MAEPPLEPERDFNATGCTGWGGVFRTMLTTMSAFIIIVGTTGNTITYFVLTQKSYANNIMAYALIYLAVMDNIILWTVVTRELIKGLFLYDFLLSSAKFCAIYQFYTLIMTSCTNWHLVTITLTRLIHLKCPFKTQVICSKLNYYLLVSFNHIAIVAVHGGILLGLLLGGYFDNVEDYDSCYKMLSTVIDKHVLYNVINVTTNIILPGTLLIVFNAIIVRELRIMEGREQMLKEKPKIYVAETSSCTKPGEMSVEVSASEMGTKDLPKIYVAETSSCTKLGEMSVEVSASGMGTKDLPNAASNAVGNRSGRSITISEISSKGNEESAIQPSYVSAAWNIVKQAVLPHSSALPPSPSLSPRLTLLPSSALQPKDARDKRLSSFSRVSFALRQPVKIDFSESDLRISVTDDSGQKDRGKHSTKRNTFNAPSLASPKGPKDGRIQSLTLLLVTASVVFLTLCLPYWIYHFVARPWEHNYEPGCHISWYVRHILSLLRFSDHCVNFYFYCATGSRFRHEFNNWLHSVGIIGT